jgi:hypothetical protein
MRINTNTTIRVTLIIGDLKFSKKGRCYVNRHYSH